MNTRHRKAITAVSLLLIFCVTQVCVQRGLAGAMGAGKSVAINPGSDQLTGKLVTRANQPILVNGNSVKTDATILSGANIETPGNVSSTINLGFLGTLDLAPNTSARIEFSNGNVSVNLAKGDVILNTRPNIAGTILTEKGEAGSVDKQKGGALDVSFPPGALAPVVSKGAAAANLGGVAAGGGVSSGPGVLIGPALIVAESRDVNAVTPPCRRGPNPSPGTPRGPGCRD